LPKRLSVLLVSSGRIGAFAAEFLSQYAAITATTIFDGPVELSAHDCVALAVDRPYPLLADRLDEACYSSGVPWCGATMLAHVAEIGPMVIPGQTPCYRCWARRRAAQAEDPVLGDVIEGMGCHSKGRWFAGELPALNRQAAALLVFEVLQLGKGRDAPPPTGMGDYWHLDALTGENTRHLYASVSQCSRCGVMQDPSEWGRHLRTWAGL
jgi:bacteriocin biosynthesis cyclodehydratase domain-containing protein